MYKELKTYIVNFSSDDSKRTNFAPSIALEAGDLRSSKENYARLTNEM
jgi:hypothetical protein